MQRRKTHAKVKELNTVLFGLGFTNAKILKFWDECKKEVGKSNAQLKLNLE